MQKSWNQLSVTVVVCITCAALWAPFVPSLSAQSLIVFESVPVLSESVRPFSTSDPLVSVSPTQTHTTTTTTTTCAPRQQPLRQTPLQTPSYRPIVTQNNSAIASSGHWLPDPCLKRKWRRLTAPETVSTAAKTRTASTFQRLSSSLR